MVNSFAHQRPIWWYLPLLFILFFPWSCWATTWRALRNLLKEDERATRFLLCWALPPFLFLSFISGKQAHYLVPLAPPLAMLLARALDCGQRVLVWDWPSRLLLAVLPLSLAALSYVPHQFAKTPALPEWIGATPSWVPAGLLASAILMLWPYRQVRTTVMGLGTANVLLVVVVGSGFMRAAQPWYDLSKAAAILAGAQAQGRPIAHQGDSDDRFRFAGRLNQPIDEIRKSAIATWSCGHPNGWVVLYYDGEPPQQTQGVVYQQKWRGGEWLRIVEATQLQSERCE